MIFEDFSNKVSCPYNKNHVFEKQKLIFHINRCKDKAKVEHLFTSCRYNRIHILPKEDVTTHEMFCPDKEEIKKLTTQLTQTLNETERERQRSREKIKREQQRQGEAKKEVKLEHTSDHVVLEDCPLCGYIIQKLDQMKQVVPPDVLAKIKLVQKMIKMNNQFIKAEQDLTKSRNVKDEM